METAAPGALSLRDAGPGDLGTIVRLVRALAEYERLAHLAVGTEADFGRWMFGPVPRAHALVAELGGATVGFAVWYYGFRTFQAKPCLYVEDVFVQPEHRGRGVGRAIFRDLARRAVAEGCDRMEWTVLDWSAPAIDFYRSIGARPREGWTPHVLNEPALSALAA